MKPPPATRDPGTAESAVPAATEAGRSGGAHISTPTAYDGILLAGFGGPEGQEDVLPFLRNVTAGRGISDDRLEEVAVHYRHFGGVSPINDQNRQLRQALEQALASAGMALPVYWGNRNWDPYLPDALHQAHAAGHTRLLMIATSAYASYSSCRQYREDLADALEATGLGEVMQVDKVRQFFDHPGFIAPFIEGVRAAVDTLRGRGARNIEVLFATHSIPVEDARRSGPLHAHDGGDGAYPAQHRGVAEVIMAALAEPGLPWQLVYQSRSGPPEQPWLEPDINDAITQLQGRDAVVIVPLGFLSDHMEVMWDLDEEAMQTASAAGLDCVRAPTPGTHPEFVAGLVDLVAERMQARPIPERAAATALGPWQDVCRPACCENVRRGFRPAIAGVRP